MADNGSDLSASIGNMSMYPRIDTSTFMAPPNYYQEIAALDTEIRQPTSPIAAPRMAAPMMPAPIVDAPKMSAPIMTPPMMSAPMMPAPVVYAVMEPPKIVPDPKGAVPSAPVLPPPPPRRRSIGNNVRLNVGGALFQTTKSTLMKFDGLLNVMMQDPEIPVEHDDAIFIDRSAKHFDKILNYLRDGHVALPESMEKLEEIQKEAKYYLLDGLVDNCEMKMAKINKKTESFAEGVHVLNTQGELLQVITEPKKPVLVIYYHVGTLGRILRPKGFTIRPFLDKYQHKLNIYFKSYSLNQTSTIDPTEWRWSLHYRGGYSFDGAATQKLAKGGSVNVEPFGTQLENAIFDFFKTHSLQF
ncbi:hypothetical protein CAEBREN_18972 [Caenorhabditis brenneri]|uniref:BTB domain-containing protein n=1 Tax=Caenorhabditis brenneri TaxID=135651 RepID=G0MV29_CAEBE|nr:hypothetical protein CAEBREN_18972 [Caenorhabditis brenneri]